MPTLRAMLEERASRWFGRAGAADGEESRARPLARFAHRLGVFVLAARGFLKDQGLHRASALAFDTVLGLVPSLALVVAVLKGFGAYDDLVRRAVRPWIAESLGSLGESGSEDAVSLQSAFFRILDFVERADFAGLGVLGLVMLIYVTVLMLISIESSLNHIFGVERSRNFWRRVADYSATLFIAPLCAILAATIAGAARGITWLGGVLILQLGVVAAMAVALTMLFLVMPFARVRVRSAALGGAVAGMLWYLSLVVHVHFQLGVARYNALYSTFAAIPIFLVWLFVSWLILLYGAELAAAHQNPGAFRWRIRHAEPDHATRRFIALRSLVDIIQAFVSGNPPPTARALSSHLAVPIGLLEDALEPLVRVRIVARTQVGGATAFLPARDIDSVELVEVFAALEQRDALELPEPADAADRTVRDVLERLETLRRESLQGSTLRKFAEHLT